MINERGTLVSRILNRRDKHSVNSAKQQALNINPNWYSRAIRLQSHSRDLELQLFRDFPQYLRVNLGRVLTARTMPLQCPQA